MTQETVEAFQDLVSTIQTKLDSIKDKYAIDRVNYCDTHYLDLIVFK